MRRGYTLVELVVVLAIMAVMTAASVPALGVWLDREPTGAEAVARLLREARERALDEARSVIVSVDPQTGQWSLDDGRKEAVTGVLRLGDADLAAADQRIVIRFAPTGGAQGEDVVVSRRGAIAVVRADPWTGEVRIDGG